MSNEQAFAPFPSAPYGSGYFAIDIFRVEAIGQSSAATVATIFVKGSDRFYQVEFSEAELEEAGLPDATSMILVRMAEADREEDESPTPPEPPADARPVGPALFHGDPTMPL